MLGRLNGAARSSIEMSLDNLAYIIGLARVFGSDLDTDADAAGDDRQARAPIAARRGAARELRDGIDMLSEDEQAVLVALAWIGRGDFTPAEFDDALSMAFERHASSTAEYLVGLPMLGDLLEQGAAACGADVSEN